MLRKLTGVGAIQWVTYEFLLVFHCNYVSVLSHIRHIITYLPKF